MKLNIRHKEGLRQTSGEFVEIDPRFAATMRFFVHETTQEFAYDEEIIWIVSEYCSGFRIGHGYSRNAAISDAQARLAEKSIEEVLAALAQSVDTYGYANPPEFLTPFLNVTAEDAWI